MTNLFLFGILPVITLLFNSPKFVAYQRIPFIFYAILGVIGYDNVCDYELYIEIFKDVEQHGIILKNFNKEYEIGYIFLNYIFSKFHWGFIFVVAISQLAIYYVEYKYFEKYNCFVWGTFFLVTSSFLLHQTNVLRQDIAIAFFLYGVQFARGGIKKSWKYFLCCFLATLFHESAAILFPVYFLIIIAREKELNEIVIFLSIVVIFFWGEILSPMLFPLIMLSSTYGDTYTSIIENWQESGILGSSMRIGSLLWPILVNGGVWYMKKYHNNLYVVNRFIYNLASISTLFYAVVSLIPFANRFVLYILLFQFLAVGLIFKVVMEEKTCSRLILILFTIVIIKFNYDQVLSYYYTYNYKTFLCEDCFNRRAYCRPSILDTDKENWNRRTLYYNY